MAKKYILYLVFGEEPVAAVGETGDEKTVKEDLENPPYPNSTGWAKKVEFDTLAEEIAYLKGLEDMKEWYDYAILSKRKTKDKLVIDFIDNKVIPNEQ